MKMNEMTIEKVARGHVQKSMAYDLLNGHKIVFCDYIASKRYYAQYIDSFLSLFARFEQEGLRIKMEMGKYGGYWTATAMIVK
ncbi:hypothetical protein [Siminovitchia sp. 179-K 8D1 HS]|uniref:hypothetical protein n=1 Tax=Siminovitchia sp. 179-K 8D1 HS TaxID=3142385 RepID=UPI00399F512E